MSVKTKQFLFPTMSDINNSPMYNSDARLCRMHLTGPPLWLPLDMVSCNVFCWHSVPGFTELKGWHWLVRACTGENGCGRCTLSRCEFEQSIHVQCTQITCLLPTGWVGERNLKIHIENLKDFQEIWASLPASHFRGASEVKYRKSYQILYSSITRVELVEWYGGSVE